MGNDEQKESNNNEQSPPKQQKKVTKFQNEYLKNKNCDPLINNIIRDLSSSQNNPNNDDNDNDNINNINFKGATGGNNSNNKKIEKISEDLDSVSVNDRLIKQNRLNDFKMKKKINMDIKKMSNKVEKEKKIRNIEIDRNNYGTIDAPMMSTSKNIYRRKIKYNQNNKEEDKKEGKKISINENASQEKVSNIKSISQNFQINNENKIDDDLVSENNIISKKLMGIRNRNRNKEKKYNNIDDSLKTINNERIKNPLLQSQRIHLKKEEDKNSVKFKINMEKKININNNINIGDDINNNININNEIKQKENDVEDDFDSNLKIDNIIESKKSFKKKINLEIKTNQNNDDDNKLPERRMMRFNSYANILLNNKIPKKVFLFDNPNIFDSFLIILNNNIFINKYLAKNTEKIEQYAIKCQQKKQYCLNGILYYINEYIWAKRPEEIKPKNELRLMYKSFMDCYIKINCNNSEPEFYLYDINNIEGIIGFIFSRINSEQTNEKKNIKIPEFKTSNKQLNKFMNDYTKNNKSIISDTFTGFYLKENLCLNCREKYMRYNNIYTPKKEYSDFNYILFDLNKNRQQYIGYQRTRGYSINPNMYENENYFNQFSNINNNIYTLLDAEFNRFNISFCDVCRINSQKCIQKQFYTLPKVLTIILKNNDGSFEINDEIKLSPYAHVPGNYNYCLIAILCKYNNNTYITYCFNHRDSNWYYFSNERFVHKVRYLDPDAVPYVLVYQNTEYLDFKYNQINKKKAYTFRFQNGLPQLTLYFGFDETVKDAKKEIKRKYSNFNNPVLLINGEKLKDYKKLNEIKLDIINKSILVLDPKVY